MSWSDDFGSDAGNLPPNCVICKGCGEEVGLVAKVTENELAFGVAIAIEHDAPANGQLNVVCRAQIAEVAAMYRHLARNLGTMEIAKMQIPEEST